MSEAMPSPLTPAECNLQDFPFMPVDVQRVLKSDTWVLASDGEKAAAVALWWESWHQVPAASLPDNDRMLAHLSQVKSWARVKAHAMRGWVLCSDGRWYHPVVAEKALEAWIEKLLAAVSGASGNAKRWGVAVNVTTGMDQLQVAIRMLAAIAPQSKTLKKKSVVSAVAGIAPGSPPDPRTQSGGESGGESAPDRNRQGQRQGQGKKRAKALSSSAKLPTCPYEDIVALYHEVLDGPEFAGVRVLDDDRKTVIREFWGWVLTSRRLSDGRPRAETPEQALAWIRGFFGRAKENDFLMGRVPRDEKHKNWKPDIEYLLKPAGVKQVLERTTEATA